MAGIDLTPKDMRNRGYLLASEAARKIGVAPQTVYRWIDADKVDGFKHGNYRRYVRWSALLKHLGRESCAAMNLDQKSIWDENAA